MVLHRIRGRARRSVAAGRRRVGIPLPSCTPVGVVAWVDCDVVPMRAWPSTNEYRKTARTGSTDRFRDTGTAYGLLSKDNKSVTPLDDANIRWLEASGVPIQEAENDVDVDEEDAANDENVAVEDDEAVEDDDDIELGEDEDDADDDIELGDDDDDDIELGDD